MAHIVNEIYKSPTAAAELVKLFLGDVLGEGAGRRVYEHQFDPTLVIKEALDGNTFQNVIEWEIWQTVVGTKHEKWFAPCIDISPNGLFLVQRKVEMLPRAKYPKEVPVFFDDMKYENFGVIGKQFVCFDYGTLHITSMRASFTEKMKKADWWGLSDGKRDNLRRGSTKIKT